MRVGGEIGVIMCYGIKKAEERGDGGVVRSTWLWKVAVTGGATPTAIAYSRI